MLRPHGSTRTDTLFPNTTLFRAFTRSKPAGAHVIWVLWLKLSAKCHRCAGRRPCLSSTVELAHASTSRLDFQQTGNRRYASYLGRLPAAKPMSMSINMSICYWAVGVHE